MERAATDRFRQAALSGLAAFWLVSCAQVQAPPGGPPDFTAPGVVSVTPDSGTAVPGFDDDVEFQFTETISETSGGGLENLFEISPRPERIRVHWRRSRVGVEPREGWRDGTVYHVRLLSGIADLQNNTLESSRSIVFTTGDSLPNSSLSGTIVDWHRHALATNGLLEAVLAPDSLVYTARVDSTGNYMIGPLQPGRYTLFGIVDQNGNGRKDRNELYDSVIVQLDTVLATTFWAHAQDTVPSRIERTTPIDSTAIEIAFQIPLLPGTEEATQVTVYSLPDTVPVGVRSIQTRAVFDSIIAERQQRVRDSLAQIADSLAADSAAADTLSADSVPADSATVDQPPPIRPDTAGAFADSTPAPPAVLDDRPRLVRRLVVVLDTVFGPDSRFLVEADATSVAGIEGLVRSVVVVPPAPEPAPQDSVSLPTDSLGALADSLTPIDSLVVLPDSLAADSMNADPEESVSDPNG